VAEDGIKKDVFVKFPDGKPFRGPVWPGDCYFPDFTDPSVRIWWGSLHQALIEDGIAGFWNDMNEPSVFSPGDGTMPHTVRHSFERRGANHDQIHNVYGSQMVRATQEGVKALRPDKRPFVLSRSGFTGVQRHAAVWTGDNESSWEHLRLSLSMVFNLGLSGVAFSGPDIGGFYGTPSPELFARWITAAALFPLCRIHTAAQTPQQEPWSFGPEVERISKKMIQLRYRLLPYLYTAFWQASQQGLPIVRPMLLAFQHDAAAQSIDDQFMVGDSLLVAPVLTAATTSRQVYLPPDHTWVDYWTGVYYVGGQTLKVDAPLDHLPIFVMSGATIPHWPLLQSTQHYKMIEAIDHHVFVAAGQSVLYEDDGEGFAYQQGQSRETHLICRQQGDRIVMTVRAQGNYTPPYERINWTIHTPAQVVPQSIVADGLTIANWSGGPLPHSFTLQTPVVQRLEIWL
jgi:alpha-glucosidase